MLFLGLAISIASIPGWTSVTIPAGWAALSAILPAVTLWRGGLYTPLHLLLTVGLIYACFASFGVDGPNALMRLWQLALFALAFHLGSTLPSLRPIWIGLAIGGSISSALAVAQWLTPNVPIMTFSLTAQAGLHYNPVMQGMILAIIAISLMSEGLWLWTLPLMPGILLSQSRGAYFVVLAGAILCKVRQPLLVLCLALVPILYATFQQSPHDIERMYIWVSTWSQLSFFGRGTGVFTDLWLIINSVALHPENVHNDYLQFLYEWGIGAAPFLALFAATLTTPAQRSWPVAAAIAIFACFTFPFYTPITLFALALCAGAASRDGSLSWRSLSGRRLIVLSFYARQRQRWDSLGSAPLAPELRHPLSTTEG